MNINTMLPLSRCFGLIGSVCILQGLATGDSLGPSTGVQLTYELANHRVPKWSHGALLFLDKDQSSSVTLLMFDQRGFQLSPITFTVPGSVSISVHDWDRGSDGTVVLSGAAVDNAGRSSSFIAWLSPSQTETQIVRTTPYIAEKVAIAPDGTLWTQGLEVRLPAHSASPDEKTFAKMLVPDAGIIRHFDRAGRQIGSFLPQSTFQKPISLMSNSFFASARDRIAWYSPLGQRYVEISGDDKTLDFQLALPYERARVTGMALTDDGRTFISTSRGTPTSMNISVLDRSHQAWVTIAEHPASADPSQFGVLYGAEGNTLVAAAGNHRLIRFYEIGR